MPYEWRCIMSQLPDVLIRVVLWSALALTFNAGWAAGATPQELLDKYRCSICHAERDAAAGPAWVDIATHYRGERQADKLVADRIRSGAHGGGQWHMPPHPEVSEADAATMARYILATKAEPIDTPPAGQRP
jgi:cytochrome c